MLLTVCRLERQTSIRSVPAERHSPWIGPLASQETLHGGYTPSGSTYARTPAGTPDGSSDSEGSDGGERWKSAPVIPMKPLMEAMGLIPSTNYYASPVIPGGGAGYRQTMSVGGSPASGAGAYLYGGSPRGVEAVVPMGHSPYVAAWMPPLPAGSPYGSPYTPY